MANYKVTDEQFLETLKETNGVLRLAPKVIYHKYGVKYTRQAVHNRVKKFARILMEIREAALDYSESGLIRCLKCDAIDPGIIFKIAKYFLDNLGKDRGYGKNGVDRILHPETKVIEIKAGIEPKTQSEMKIDNAQLTA